MTYLKLSRNSSISVSMTCGATWHRDIVLRHDALTSSSWHMPSRDVYPPNTGQLRVRPSAHYYVADCTSVRTASPLIMCRSDDKLPWHRRPRLQFANDTATILSRAETARCGPSLRCECRQYSDQYVAVAAAAGASAVSRSARPWLLLMLMPALLTHCA